MEKLDFKENTVQVLTLDDLKRTHRENDVFGRPIMGMYHFDIIDKVSDILLSHNLKMEIKEIFAAQNRTRQNPGVVVLPEVEKQYGENAVEAHILRRIYANVEVHDFDNDEFTTNVAIAFHQKQIQIAYGTMVKICHNQCILSPERVLSTGRNMTLWDMLHKFDSLMDNIHEHIDEEHQDIDRMKAYVMTPQQILMAIGEMCAIRVAHDTKYETIRQNAMYPLNQSQISQFTENMLLKQKDNDQITMWDFYNVATELMKANNMEIPNIFPQHLALSEFVKEFSK